MCRAISWGISFQPGLPARLLGTIDNLTALKGAKKKGIIIASENEI
jgi:hypothetical protein